MKINEFIQIELMQKAADENEKRLQEMEKRLWDSPLSDKYVEQILPVDRPAIF